MSPVLSGINSLPSAQPTPRTLKRAAEWTGYMMRENLSGRLDGYVSSGAVASKGEFENLMKGAFASNRKSMHHVANVISKITRDDKEGKNTVFITNFLSLAGDSAYFAHKLFDQKDSELCGFRLDALSQALETIYIRNRLQPESELWHRVKCNDGLFKAAVQRVAPMLGEFTANGTGRLTLVEGIKLLELLGTWEKCEVPDVIIANEATCAISEKGSRQFERVLRLLRLIDIGFKDAGFIFDLHNPKNGDEERKWLLGAYRIEKFADAPHKVFVERDSGDAAQNNAIKSTCGGYFALAKHRSIVFNDILGKHDLIGMHNIPSEVIAVPHEMEHSLQALIGMDLGSVAKEHGATIASLLCIGDRRLNLLLHSWDDRINRNKKLAYIFSDKVGDIGFTRPHFRLLKEIGGIQLDHPRMKNIRIVRKLLDDFYNDAISITYTALEKAAEGIFRKNESG